MAKSQVQFSKQDDWGTPKAVVDALGPFDYDPATTKERAELFGIPNYDTIQTDGLKTDWTQFHRIYVNSPFSRKFEFLEKAVKAAKAGSIVYFLIPIDSLVTKRFHDVVGGAEYELILPSSRIKFELPDNKTSSPAFGSVILKFGREHTERGLWARKITHRTF